MRLARWIYGVAGAYGLLILVPGLFVIRDIGAPPLNHLEFYYGFYGSAIAWQIVFFLIASDPVRWRAFMPITFLEKIGFFVACLWLYHAHQLAIGGPFIGAMIDGVWLVLFVIAWLRTPKAA